MPPTASALRQKEIRNGALRGILFFSDISVAAENQNFIAFWLQSGTLLAFLSNRSTLGFSSWLTQLGR